MEQESSNASRWYWAWIVLATVQKRNKSLQSAPVEVWLNLVILSACDADEAIRKAMECGQREAGDCRGSLRLDGKPAVTRFLGIQDIGLIHDDIQDGAEILWRVKRCKMEAALRMPKEGSRLRQILIKELAFS